jgi:hypothetical protein
LNVDQSKYRTLDYITGRWWQIDPKGDAGGQERWSTYQFAFDNAIRYNDPKGDCIPCLIVPAINTAAALKVKYSNILQPGQNAGQRVLANKSGSVPSGAEMSKVNENIIKTTSTAADGVQVAKSAAKLSTEVVKDGAKGAQASGDALQKTGVAISAVGLPEVGAPIAAVGTTLSTVGTALGTVSNLMQGNYAEAAAGLLGAVIDKKVGDLIGSVVKSQGLNQQSEAILQANKEVVKEVAGQVIEERKRN